MKTNCEVIKFYVSNSNKECDLIRKIMNFMDISYSEINAEKKEILPYLLKDLGIDMLPAIATKDGIFSGSSKILKYLRVNEDIYMYLDS